MAGLGIGGGNTITVDGTVFTKPVALSMNIDLVGGSSPIYLGKAAPTSATSAAAWQIQKYTYSGSNVVAIQYAGAGAFTNVWDDRVGLVYA